MSLFVQTQRKAIPKNAQIAAQLLASESESCSVTSDSLQPHGLYSPWNSLGQDIEVDSLSLLQGIFPTQRQNPGLPHCKKILYQLSHKGSPRILESQPIPSPVDLPNPGIKSRSPALQGDALPTELSGKPIERRSDKLQQTLLQCHVTVSLWIQQYGGHR